VRLLHQSRERLAREPFQPGDVDDGTRGVQPADANAESIAVQTREPLENLTAAEMDVLDAIDKMASAGRSLGWHPFPGPAAVNSRSYQNRSACMYHGFCNRGGCHVDAKNSTAVTTIPRAQATGHLNLVTCAHVTPLKQTDTAG
jgi:hypothetical protein